MPQAAKDSHISDVSTAEHSDAAKSNGHEIAHVLFLDIVGFTKLRSPNQRYVLGMLQDIVRATINFCDASRAGKLIASPTGDGMALVFLTSVGGSGTAVSCAEEIAKAIQAHNESTGDDEMKIQVRMGIHSGNVVRVRDVNERANVAGEGVNTAQRVMDCGDVGHILLSNVAFRLLPDEPDRSGQFKPLGIVRVKHDQEINLFNWFNGNIGNPETPATIESEKKQEQRRFEKIRDAIERERAVQRDRVKEELEAAARKERRRWVVGASAILLLVTSTVFITKALQKPRTQASLAVVPFKAQTPKYSSKAISKGLTDQFIRSFRELTNVEPKPLSSVFTVTQDSANQPNSRPLSPVEIGKKLNVQYVLTGTVHSLNDDANLINLSEVNPNFDVAIHAELFNAETGESVWKRHYTSKPFDKLIELQKQIVTELAAEMEIPMRATVNANDYSKISSAHWYYLLGRFWSTRPDVPPGEDVVEKAIESYKKAIDKDPSYALAHAGLADMYSSYSGTTMDPKLAQAEAAKAAREAEKWGEKLGLAEVYGAIGTENWWLEGKFATARIAFVLAIKLNPELADSHKRYSSYLAAMCDHDEAERQILEAIKVEPDSAFMRFAAGQNYFFANKYSRAIEQLREALKMKSNLWDAHRFLAMALAQQGANEEALLELNKVPIEVRRDNSDFAAASAYIQARFGDTNQARNMAKRLEELRESRTKNEHYVSCYNIAAIYAAIPNEEETAVTWLTKAVNDSDPRTKWLNVDPRFAELRKAKRPDFDNLGKALAMSPCS